MALEPYRRRVGVPDAPGPSGVADTRVADIGGKISDAANTLLVAAQPMLEQKARARAMEDAGNRELTRDDNGNLILPKAEEGGALYRAALDDLLRKRYAASINYEWQNWLSTEQRARRDGTKPYDPEDFRMEVMGRMEGMLQGMDPSMRPEMAEVLAREALERTNTFESEYGREMRAQNIRGGMSEVKRLQERIATAVKRGVPEEIPVLREQLAGVVQGLQTAHILGGAEVGITMMETDDEIADVQRYLADADGVAAASARMDRASKSELEFFLRVADNPYGYSGDVLAGSEDADKYAKWLHDKHAAELSPRVIARLPFDGAKPGSRFGVDRERGLRKHKGLDFPGRAGTPVRTINPVSGTAYTSSSEKGGNIITVRHDDGSVSRYMHLDGFRVTNGERVDADTVLAGIGRSGNATGYTLHVEWLPDGKTAVDPMSVIGKAIPGAQAVAAAGVEVLGLTSEQMRGMDPSHVTALKRQAAARLADIAEAEREARQQAAEEERQRRTEEKLEAVVNSIKGANSLGIGGHLDSEQKAVLDEAFDRSINMGKVGELATRQMISGFIQSNQYVPGPVVAYIENQIRNPVNFRTALDLWRDIRGATLQGGARVGDVLEREVDARTRALLTTADRMDKDGRPDAEIASFIDRVRGGTVTPFKQAKQFFNERKPPTVKGRDSYDYERDKLIRSTYGLSDNTIIPKPLIDVVNQSYSAYVDSFAGQPEAALREAVKQNTSTYVRKPYFKGFIGPKVLTDTYSDAQIASMIAGLTKDGKRIVPPGARFQIQADDDDINQIGHYTINVFYPDGRKRFFPGVDFGARFAEWRKRKLAQQRPAVPGADPVAAARASGQPVRKAREQFAPFAKPMM